MKGKNGFLVSIVPISMLQKQATRFSTFLRLLWESEIIVGFSQKLFSWLH